LAVFGGSVRNVETFITEDLDVSIREVPFLIGGSLARLKGDSGVIFVSKRNQAEGCALSRRNGLFATGRCGITSIDDVPILVVSTCTIIELGRIPVIRQSTPVIQTFVRIEKMNSPGKGPLFDPHLVLIPTKAGEDLHLFEISSYAIGVVQAFVAENLEGVVRDGPELAGGSGDAVFNDYGGSVDVTGGGEAFRSIDAGVDEFLPWAGGWDSEDGGEAGEKG